MADDPAPDGDTKQLSGRTDPRGEMEVIGSPWEMLDRWSPRLFFVAGAVLAVYAALNGLIAFADATVEPKVFEAGYVAAFLGLLGLYPSLADRTPWLAGVGAATAVLGLVAFSVFTAGNLAELAGLTSGDEAGSAVFTVMAAVGFVVGYLAVGAAVLRSGAFSRTVGLLLLVPGVIIALMIGSIAADLASPESVFVVSAGQAMAHLALGATLSADTESAADERSETEAASDATARG